MALRPGGVHAGITAPRPTLNAMRRFAQAFADGASLPPGLPHDVAHALVAAPDRYNISKGRPAAVIAANKHGVPVVGEMAWGLVPRWSKQASTPYTTVTARLERAPRSRIFAQAWQLRRCMVAMSGYFKWDRQRKPPWPRFIQRTDGVGLLAAGLWEYWDDPDGGEGLLSFSLLTGPNAAIPSPLTPDGPVFLEAATGLRWVRGEFSTPGALARRAVLPSLESYPVSRRISDASRDEYTLLEPVDPDIEAVRLDDELEAWEDED